MSLFISLIAVLNLSSKSVFPIVFDAWTICLSNSSNLRIHLTIDPSKMSVILHKSLKDELLHHENTTSIKNGLNLSTYVSSSRGRRASVLTFAILLARSCENVGTRHKCFVKLVDAMGQYRISKFFTLAIIRRRLFRVR